MNFSFLNNIKNDKTRITTSIILEKGCHYDFGDIPFYMAQAALAFKLYGDMVKEWGSADTTKKISPEKHLLNMFKLLFVSNISFDPGMMDSLVCLYLWNTKESLYRQIRKTLKDTSIYNRMLGKKNYSDSSLTYKNIYRFLHNSGPALFLEPDERVIYRILNKLEDMKGSSVIISHIIPDESRLNIFNDKLKKKELLFRRDKLSGLMIPFSLSTDMEFGRRWEEF